MTPEAPDRLVRSPSNSSPAADIRSLQHSGTSPIVRPTIPDHELLKKIGGGSYGEVWLARNILGSFRAVKIVYRSSFDHDRPFEREFAGIQKFEPISRTHESQVDILHVGRGEGYFYYVMELADEANVDGLPGRVPSPGGECQGEGERSPFVVRDPLLYMPRTLKLELQRRGRLPFDDCVQIGLSLTTALAHLHKHGLVHRDIKPSNIIFVHGRAKLADIGLVTSMDATRSFVGTEGYLSPEGPGTPQADIYSLGKVLYEMGTGQDRRHFPALPPEIAQLADQQQLSELNSVVVKACQHDPRLRYPTAEAMQADLARLQAGRSVRRQRTMERRWATLKKVGALAAALALLIASPALIKMIRHSKAPNPEARRLYLQAQYLLSRLTDESVAKAMSNLELAIKIDPQFVPAYITLFEIYCWNPGGISDREQAQKVKEIAAKLLSFDRNLGEGHAALAMSKFDEADWPGAEAEIQKAIKLKPNYSIAHGTYGFISALSGRPREGHRELEEAQRLDPVSRIQATVAGFPFLVERDYDGALAQFRKAMELDPKFPLAHMWAGVALEAKGDYLGAIAEYENFDTEAGEDQTKVLQDYQSLRQGFQEGGEKGYWRKALELAQAKLTDKNNKMFANELWELPGIYAQLGEKDKALALLEKDLAADELSPWLRVKPCYESLRDEQRFKRLLESLGVRR